MTNQFCRRCGCRMLKKHAPEDITEKVRQITGQSTVWVFLCPVCYPEKVAAFLPHKKVKK